jgi:hypothetical protein
MKNMEDPGILITSKGKWKEHFIDEVVNYPGITLEIRSCLVFSD